MNKSHCEFCGRKFDPKYEGENFCSFKCESLWANGAEPDPDEKDYELRRRLEEERTW